MSEIVFEKVSNGYDKIDVIRRIYEEAFPESERGLSIEEIVQISTISDCVQIVAAIEDGKIVGMMANFVKDEYCYLMYLAVDSECRGNGLGSRLMKALTDYYSDRPVIFSIETPVEGTSNYEQRVKRQMFYERLGFIKSNLLMKYGDDSYTYYSNRKCDNIKELVVNFLISSQEEKKKVKPDASNDPNLVYTLVEV